MARRGSRSGWGRRACAPLGTGTTTRCVNLTWPFAGSAYAQDRGLVQTFSWQGSLLLRRREASGLTYQRNRMYDPSTGRFTQEDPIGLAGGLNTYGFAGGDPVNAGDPFGLACEPPESKACQIIDGIGKRLQQPERALTIYAGAIAALFGGAIVAEFAGTATAADALVRVPVRGATFAVEPAGGEVSAGALRAMQNQLANAGRSSVERTMRTLAKRIAEHEVKIIDARAAGGNVSSMEREIRAWRQTLDAARKVLGNQ